jgi:uncharacterized Zn finger protein (UPF0148 family)
MPATKIATCTYCGTRAALVLEGSERHELACSACGAPLHDLKRLKTGHVDAAAHRAPRKGKKKVKAGDRRDRRAEMPVAPPPDLWEVAQQKPKKRRKPRKRMAKRLFEEAFDLLEDIFD